ncbi:IS3 family transposase [Streptomyces sp. NPDC015220]|uniref:IS3 family transposase n=1 Tax=Streptomyces sp. NPDC015220 TaxID=3364947 RepID=UPI003702AE8B
MHRGRSFATRAGTNHALFEYADGFFNPCRIQKRLGHPSPIEFEEKHYANQATTETAHLGAPQTRPDQLVSTSRAAGEVHSHHSALISHSQ